MKVLYQFEKCIDSFRFLKYKYNLTVSIPFMIQPSPKCLLTIFSLTMFNIHSNYSCYNSIIIYIIFLKNLKERKANELNTIIHLTKNIRRSSNLSKSMVALDPA